LEKKYGKLIAYYSTKGGMHLLIIDGHDSHVTWEFLDYCLQNDIIPLCLPAHSTHILQPLDVGLFGPLQSNYSKCLDDFVEGGETGINKGDFYPYAALFLYHISELLTSTGFL